MDTKVSPFMVMAFQNVLIFPFKKKINSIQFKRKCPSLKLFVYRIYI